jgi:hypothetical protein
MFASVKAAWLKALRSGEYAQGSGRLRTTFPAPGTCSGQTYQFCCLGVLADVVDPMQKTWKPHEAVFAEGHDRRDQDDLIGCSLGNYFIKDRGVGKLVEMNDSDKASFAEIADWIEANIPVSDVPPTEVCAA